MTMVEGIHNISLRGHHIGPGLHLGRKISFSWNILETGKNEIFVEKNIINRARGSIEKLLKFTRGNERTGLANDA